MKGLNLAGWSKVGEDKNSTTLKHDKGHMMTIVHTKLPGIQREALKRLKLADGTPDGTVGDKSGDKPQSPVTVNVGQPALSPPTQTPQPGPVNVPAVPQTPNVLLPNGSMSAPGSAQTAQEGAKLGAQVQASKAAAAVPQEQQYLEQTRKYNEDFANNLNDVKQKADDFSGYMKQNPLKENAYLEDGGAGRKMGTALGLLFSGAGSGVTGQPNMAYDFLNKQIDRNIDAQKERFRQHQTVWGAYNDLYKNETVANNMARVHALDMLTHQAQLTAAQLGTPSAAAGLMDLQSKVAPERNKLILDSAGNLSSTPNMPRSGAKPAVGGIPGQSAQKANPNQDLIDQGLVAGTPSNKHGTPQGEANAQAANPGEDYYDSHILVPGAVQHFKNLAYTPKAKEDLAAIQAQYGQATQAEKGLADVHGKFSDLAKETNGMSGRFHRNASSFGHTMGAVGAGIGTLVGGPVGAGIGAAAGEGLGGVGRLATNTSANRTYDSDQTALLGYLSAALKGTNIGSGQIQEIVDANSPETGDTPELLAKKEKNIREFIINHTDTSLLKTWGLSKR